MPTPAKSDYVHNRADFNPFYHQENSSITTSLSTIVKAETSNKRFCRLCVTQKGVREVSIIRKIFEFVKPLFFGLFTNQTRQSLILQAKLKILLLAEQRDLFSEETYRTQYLNPLLQSREARIKKVAKALLSMHENEVTATGRKSKFEEIYQEITDFHTKNLKKLQRGFLDRGMKLPHKSLLFFGESYLQMIDKIFFFNRKKPLVAKEINTIKTLYQLVLSCVTSEEALASAEQHWEKTCNHDLFTKLSQSNQEDLRNLQEGIYTAHRFIGDQKSDLCLEQFQAKEYATARGNALAALSHFPKEIFPDDWQKANIRFHLCSLMIDEELSESNLAQLSKNPDVVAIASIRDKLLQRWIEKKNLDEIVPILEKMDLAVENIHEKTSSLLQLINALADDFTKKGEVIEAHTFQHMLAVYRNLKQHEEEAISGHLQSHVETLNQVITDDAEKNRKYVSQVVALFSLLPEAKQDKLIDTMHDSVKASIAVHFLSSHWKKAFAIHEKIGDEALRISVLEKCCEVKKKPDNINIEHVKSAILFLQQKKEYGAAADWLHVTPTLQTETSLVNNDTFVAFAKKKYREEGFSAAQAICTKITDETLRKETLKTFYIEQIAKEDNPKTFYEQHPSITDVSCAQAYVQALQNKKPLPDDFILILLHFAAMYPEKETQFRAWAKASWKDSQRDFFLQWSQTRSDSTKVLKNVEKVQAFAESLQQDCFADYFTLALVCLTKNPIINSDLETHLKQHLAQSTLSAEQVRPLIQALINTKPSLKPETLKNLWIILIDAVSTNQLTIDVKNWKNFPKQIFINKCKSIEYSRANMGMNNKTKLAPRETLWNFLGIETPAEYVADLLCYYSINNYKEQFKSILDKYDGNTILPILDSLEKDKPPSIKWVPLTTTPNPVQEIKDYMKSKK